MEKLPEIQRAPLNKFRLDAKNPRLGLRQTEADISQEKILDLMNAWSLEELAVSYLESGFWTHEALLVVEEEIDDESILVVVEGNRRLAALNYLHRAVHRKPIPRNSRKWHSLVENLNEDNLEELQELFNHIPYIEVDSREAIEAFLGFRHVTGIKQWPSEQKAKYIANLIDENEINYEDAMRQIGSRTSTVRDHYIAYRLLQQMEDCLKNFSPEDVRGRFSVMYLSLRTQGVQKYLHIDLSADPQDVQNPVPQEHMGALRNFARWLFGSKQRGQKPLFNDSRRVNDFSRILESSEGLKYLESKEKPDFDYAFQLAGGEEYYLVQLLNEATSNVRSVLKRVHDYKDSEDIQEKAEILGIKFQQLMHVLPNVDQRLREQGKEN